MPKTPDWYLAAADKERSHEIGAGCPSPVPEAPELLNTMPTETGIPICPKCGQPYDRTSNAQTCCPSCQPPVADPIQLSKAEKIERLEARIAELEEIIGDLPCPVEAKKLAGIKCHHLPRLIIGSESGYICCECWAQEAESALNKAADAAERCDYSTVAQVLFPYKSK